MTNKTVLRFEGTNIDVSTDNTGLKTYTAIVGEVELKDTELDQLRCKIIHQQEVNKVIRELKKTY